jgi:hypothetical protein
MAKASRSGIYLSGIPTRQALAEADLGDLRGLRLQHEEGGVCEDISKAVAKEMSSRRDAEDQDRVKSWELTSLRGRQVDRGTSNDPHGQIRWVPDDRG